MTLAAAIDVFRELGWSGAGLDEIMTLPLGTPAQRRVAKAGLAKGAWGGIEQLDERSWGWRSSVDVDTDLLGAFAVRVGVTARRAAEIFPRGLSPRIQGELLAERGADFVAAFVRGGRRALWESAGIVYAMALTGAETPSDPDYLERWAGIAVGAMGEQGEVPADIIGARYRDSLTALLQGAVPVRFDAAALVGGGVERGWITVEEARQLVLFAMDRAQRPSDRVAWSRVLSDTLGAPHGWLRERASVLISAMSFGDDAVITAFVPVLLSAGEDELAMPALLVGLAARSAKARAAVLAAALEAPVPGADVIAAVGEQVSELADAKDRRVAQAARAVMVAWGITAAPAVETPPEQPRGLWRATPAIAEVPRFDAGEASPEHLTTLASALVTGAGEPVALVVERFLATANALARTDAEAARTALRGVRPSWARGLVGVHPWVTGGECPAADRRGSYQPAYTARDTAVFQRLGSVPRLLSTPSWDDFRIDPGDLADRLEAYGEQAVLEADLQIALARLDLDLVTADLERRLGDAPHPVLLQDGAHAAARAGEILARWLREPAAYPERSDDPWSPVRPVPAIADLPPRLTASFAVIDATLFPNWSEAAFDPADARVAAVRSRPNGVAPSTLLLNNVGEGATPLDAAIAAWERGVLVPGIATADALSWRGAVSSIAARAEAWSVLAEAGMLSVVWPLAVDVVALSAAGARVAPGVAELVEMLARYLPEVELAVATGLAPAEALAMTPVRRLAERGGSSAAVRAARDLAGRLPAPEPAETAIAAAAPAPSLSDDEFARVWPPTADPDPLDDGAAIVVDVVASPRGPVPVLVLTLPSGEVVRAERPSWLFAVVHEAQAEVTDADGAERWLRYEQGGLVLAPSREAPGDEREVSRALVALMLVSQTLKDSETYYFADAVRRHVVGARAIDDAVRALLPCEGFDPYRVMRVLRYAPETLPALWPVLRRAIEHAESLGKSPAWLVRIIDVVTEHADPLRAAAARGLIPGDWPGLASAATSASSAAARRKARILLDALGI